MINSITARKRARSALSIPAAKAARNSRGIRNLLGFLGLCLAALIAPLSAHAAGKVVISQIYGAGGNTGATFQNDFIELFNAGDAPVSLNGWSVQYASAAGSSWQVTALTNVSLAAGQYYLVKEAGGAVGTAITNQDTTGSIAMSASAGKIALVNSITALSGACPVASAVVDLIGFGATATCSEPEGSNNPAPAPSNTTADFRKSGGCVDTDNNSADFVTATPSPRYTGTTPLNSCSGTPPTGVGTATPSTLNPGDTVKLSVAVTQGSPGSAITTVTVDLSAFGGSATQSLFDDGSNGDTTSGDGTYSLNFVIPVSTTGGAKTVNATIKDAVGRTSALVPINFTVNAPTAISASGAANPATLGVGQMTLLTVVVTPGTNPASTGLTVVADLSAIGGSATQTFFDDGTHGDVTNGDNTYSFLATVNSGSGAISIPVSIADTQSRTATASIALTVVPTLSIMDIQGHGGRSAYAGPGTALGSLLKTPSAGHTNIVTALKISGTSNGFFMQDATGDGDPTTSDAIFVFTGATVPAVAIGDAVVVTGKVQEFSGSTEIAGSPTVTVASSGNPPPVAYDLTTHLPSTNPTQGICMGPGSTINTATDGYQASNFACLDGMLVRMSNGVVAAPTSGSGGSGIKVDTAQFFYATAGNPRPFREPGLAPGDANIASHPNVPVYDGDPELVEIYYPGLAVTAASLPDAGSGHGIYNAGQHFDLTGIIQGFQPAGGALTYEMYPRSAADLVLVGAPPVYPVAVATPAPGKLTIGSQNGLHFFNDTPDGADTTQYTDNCAGTGTADTCPTHAQYLNRLSKMSLQIRTVLKAPVIQVLQEVENLSVATDIANKIHSDDSSLTYQPYAIQGNDPGGINIAILVRSGVTVNSVSQLAKPTLTDACSSPGTCLQNDRPPVLLDATYQGYRFRVLAIYDRSLINLGVNDYVGRKRRQQAEQISRIVQVLQTNGATLAANDACDAQQDATGAIDTTCALPITGSSTIPFVVLGDFNAYEFSDGYVDVVGTIMGTVDTDPTHSVYPPTTVAGPYDPVYVAPNPPLVNSVTPLGNPLTDPDHWNDNYSYTFNGYAQEIDHILLSSVANADFVRVSHAHGNADVSSSSADVLDPTTARRTSDHDGQVVTLGHVVTPVGGSNGTWTPSTPQTASSTSTLVFTLAPASGYSGGASDTCGAGGTSAGSFNAVTNQYTLPAGITVDCIVSVQLAVSVDPLSHGSVDSAPHSVAYSGTTTFTFTPDVGYHFGAITDNCGVGGTFDTLTSKYTTGAVTHDCAVHATFVVNNYNVSANVTGGTVDAPSKNADFGTTASFTFTPNAGFHLVSATDTCGAGGNYNAGTGVYTTAPVAGDCSISVVFALYTVSANVTGGTVDAPSKGVATNASASFTFTPTAGYHFVSASDTCGAGGSYASGTGVYTTGPVNADCSISVVYANTYAVAANVSGGTVDSASKSVVSGSTTTFTFTANAGYHIASATDTCGAGGSFNAGTGVYTTGAISGDCAVTVTFAPGYVAVTPSRILDTRAGGTTGDHQYEAIGALGAQTKLDLTVLGRGGVPGTGVGAVVVNVTETNPSANGFVTAWPAGAARPTASNLNFSPATTVSNLVIVKLGTAGQISLFNSAGTTDLIADVVGYFSDASDLNSFAPTRLLDTRPGRLTFDHQFEGSGALAAQTKIDLDLASRGPLPAAGAFGAVIMNVTATDTTADGFVTAWPAGETRPTASTLNFVAGQTIPNLVVGKVNAAGQVSLFNSAGTTDLIADVTAYFPGTSTDLAPLTPARLLETRAGRTTVDGQFQGIGPLPAHATFDLTVTNRGGVPNNATGAVVLNVTVTQPVAAGFLVAWPSGTTRPATSNINFATGQTIANLAIVKIGTAGKVSLFNNADTDVIVDVVGYLPGAP